MEDLFRDLGGLTGVLLLIDKARAWHARYKLRRELERRAAQGDALVARFEEWERKLEEAKRELLAKSKRPKEP